MTARKTKKESTTFRAPESVGRILARSLGVNVTYGSIAVR